MEFYKKVVSPVLDKLDPETWHMNALRALHLAEATPLTLWLLKKFADQHERFSDERLRVVFGGIVLGNPVGVGAGWDKYGMAVKALSQLDYGHVEAGTVTARPQIGNPRPRLLALRDGVVLNRMGFNSPGGRCCRRKPGTISRHRHSSWD